MNYLYAIFATTVFLSSFLLFSLTAPLGKHFTSLIGENYSWWFWLSLTLAGLIIFGYLYARLLSRLKISYQVIIHIGVVVGIILLVKGRMASWSSIITPDLVVANGVKITSFLILFLNTVALPVLLLASTAWLLMNWFKYLSNKGTVSFHNLFIIGAMAGIFSYFSVANQSLIQVGQWWAYGLVTYVILLLTIIYLLLILNKQAKKVNIQFAGEGLSTYAFSTWLSLAIFLFVSTFFVGLFTSTLAPELMLWFLPFISYLILAKFFR